MKVVLALLACGTASAFVPATTRRMRTAPMMAAEKPGDMLRDFSQKAAATAVSLMLVAAPLTAAPDAALAAKSGGRAGGGSFRSAPRAAPSRAAPAPRAAPSYS